MERFVKEYASYIVKTAKSYKDNEKAEKIVRIRMRGLISTSEAMAELAKLDNPSYLYGIDLTILIVVMMNVNKNNSCFKLSVDISGISGIMIIEINQQTI